MLRTATIRHFICWFSRDSDSFCRSEDEGAILVWSLTPFVTAGFLLQRWLFRFSRFPVFLVCSVFPFSWFVPFCSFVPSPVRPRLSYPTSSGGFSLRLYRSSSRAQVVPLPCSSDLLFWDSCCPDGACLVPVPVLAVLRPPLQISNVFTYSPLSTRVCLFLRACYWVRHSCDVAVCSLFLPRDCVIGCLHLRTKKRFCVNTCAGSLVL